MPPLPPPAACVVGLFVLLAQQQFSGHLTQCVSLAGEVFYRVVGPRPASSEAEDWVGPVQAEHADCPALECDICPEPIAAPEIVKEEFQWRRVVSAIVSHVGFAIFCGLCGRCYAQGYGSGSRRVEEPTEADGGGSGNLHRRPARANEELDRVRHLLADRGFAVHRGIAGPRAPALGSGGRP